MGQMMQESNDYTATLQPLSDGSFTTLTFTTQSGLYVKCGAMVFFCVNLVTTHIQKTTVSDIMQINLPYPAANLPFTTHTMMIGLEMNNATQNVNANIGKVDKNTSVLSLQAAPLTGGPLRDFTYGAADLGAVSGVDYTNVVTIRASGWYVGVTDAG